MHFSAEKGGEVMDQKIMDLYNEYKCGLWDRREFLKKLSVCAGSIAAAAALLPFIEKNYAQAEVVPKDDSRLQTAHIQYSGATGEVRAYMARPKGDAKLPGVVVIHEIWGLNPHIEDVTRRLALGGVHSGCPGCINTPGGNSGRSQ